MSKSKDRWCSYKWETKIYVRLPLNFCAMNKRPFFLFLLFLFLSVCAYSQSDSLTLVNAQWSCDSVHGMVLKTLHFKHQEYFNSNQFMAILEIPVHSGHGLALAHEPVRTRTSVMAKRHAAVAAVNGSFFDMDKHNPICYLRIDGKEVGINEPGKDTVNRKYYQYGTLVIDSGRPQIVQTDSNRMWERSLPFSDIMTAGPLLIYKGRNQPMRNDLSFVHSRHPRTAIGIRSDGTVLLFVVDGRMKLSAGMSLDELIQTLRWLGCSDALNLDGGGSTTLYIKDAPHGGIVNHPTDNALFDYAGERAVSNAVLVY